MTQNHIPLTDCTYTVDDAAAFKQKMLRWANQCNIFCFLDSLHYPSSSQYEVLLAVGSRASCSGNLSDLDAFLREHPDWCFGHLSYDLKESIHGLSSPHQNPIRFPAFHFFVPQTLLLLRGQTLVIHANDPDQVFRQVSNQDLLFATEPPRIQLQERISRERYLSILEDLKGHILRGDCYEINFCQEFFAEDLRVDMVDLFERLVQISPNPFSALYRYHDQYLACASPERFLRKEGSRLLSQPIKGTIRRDPADPRQDELLRQTLSNSAKDQAENVMVVDLVRNDLAQVCREGSVQVDELFGVYAYPQVYQMISTISGEWKPDTSFSELLRACFPMGSMTGAPKRRVMELIDRYEASARGLFSGSVGYFDDKGNFDFNVVIRSLLYNASDRYLSCQVGSGITFYSDPVQEWEECLLKAAAIKKVLTGGGSAL